MRGIDIVNVCLMFMLFGIVGFILIIRYVSRVFRFFRNFCECLMSDFVVSNSFVIVSGVCISMCKNCVSCVVLMLYDMDRLSGLKISVRAR